MAEKPELLSLFCGCGGLDLGFEQAGLETALAYDLRKPAIDSFNHNRKKIRAFVRDVTKLGLKDFDRDYGGHFSPSGVIGGPPCQSFSRGNSSKREDDPRSELVGTFFDIALKLHKKRNALDFIVMENVPEVATANGGALLSKEVRRLENAGFYVSAEIFNAKHYGVAQNRRRLVLVALNSTRVVSPWQAPKKLNKVLRLKDVIKGLPDPVYFSNARSC